MTSHGAFRKILFGAGLVGVVVGIAIMVYAVVYLGPNVAALSEELSEGLSMAESGIAHLGREAELFQASFDALEHTRASLRESATALVSTAATLREVVSPTGIVIPGESLDETASALESTAAELEVVAEEIGEMQEEGSDMDMPPIRAVLDDVAEQIGDTEEALSQAPSSQGVVALTLLQGGMYILLGALALAVSGVIGSLEALATSREVPERA